MEKKGFTKFWIVLSILFVGLAGCSSSVKADKKLRCNLQSENDGATFNSIIEIDYDSESKEPIKAEISQLYGNIPKTETNNQILQVLLEKQTVLDQLAGVDISLDVTDDSFDYKEKWDYEKLDMKSVLEADANQNEFVEKDKYSIKKIKASYEQGGYSCYSEDLK